jgi:WD40 repeat protein
VAELAATLHGRPKDELTGEDLRQHRRTKRIQWSAVMALLTLTVASLVAFIIAFSQYHLADERGKIALSRQLAVHANNVVDSQLDRALLLSVEAVAAYRGKPTAEAREALLRALQKSPQLLRYLHAHKDMVLSLAFSPDGQTLASGSNNITIRLLDVDLQSSLNRACALANRNLKSNEWKHYMGNRPYRKPCPDLPVPEE